MRAIKTEWDDDINEWALFFFFFFFYNIYLFFLLRCQAVIEQTDFKQASEGLNVEANGHV